MNEYWRQRLGGNLGNCYETVLACLKNMGGRVELPRLSNDEIRALLTAVDLDHPEIFYLDRRFKIEVSPGGIFGGSRGGARIAFDYLYSPRECAQIERALYDVVNSIALSYDGTVQDAERKICEYLVRNTVYEVDNVRNQNVASALYFKRAQCSGISRAVKYVLDCLGKWCIVVDGTGASNSAVPGPHSWNIVQADGNYYHLDATYLMGANKDVKVNGAKEIRYLYFNYSDRKALEKHAWDRSSTPPCTDKKYDGGGVPEISSLYEFKKLLSTSNGKARFTYKTDVEFTKLQKLLMDTIQSYCRQYGLTGRIGLGCVGGIWEAEYPT